MRGLEDVDVPGLVVQTLGTDASKSTSMKSPDAPLKVVAAAMFLM